jgi:hypothetical protein
MISLLNVEDKFLLSEPRHQMYNLASVSFGDIV